MTFNLPKHVPTPQLVKTPGINLDQNVTEFMKSFKRVRILALQYSAHDGQQLCTAKDVNNLLEYLGEIGSTAMVEILTDDRILVPDSLESRVEILTLRGVEHAKRFLSGTARMSENTLLWVGGHGMKGRLSSTEEDGREERIMITPGQEGVRDVILTQMMEAWTEKSGSLQLFMMMDLCMSGGLHPDRPRYPVQNLVFRRRPDSPSAAIPRMGTRGGELVRRDNRHSVESRSVEASTRESSRSSTTVGRVEDSRLLRIATEKISQLQEELLGAQLKLEAFRPVAQKLVNTITSLRIENDELTTSVTQLQEDVSEWKWKYEQEVSLVTTTRKQCFANVHLGDLEGLLGGLAIPQKNDRASSPISIDGDLGMSGSSDTGDEGSFDADPPLVESGRHPAAAATGRPQPAMEPSAAARVPVSNPFDSAFQPTDEPRPLSSPAAPPGAAARRPAAAYNPVHPPAAAAAAAGRPTPPPYAAPSQPAAPAAAVASRPPAYTPPKPPAAPAAAAAPAVSPEAGGGARAGGGADRIRVEARAAFAKPHGARPSDPAER